MSIGRGEIKKNENLISDKSTDMLFSEELDSIKRQLNTLTDKYGVKEGISLQMDKKRGWWAIINVDQFDKDSVV